MAVEVLLVDDEEDFSDLTKGQLTRRGFSVTVAADGAEALRRVKERKPDVIVLDILMPAINGVDVLKRLKEDPETSSIPVIVCSVTMKDLAQVRGLIGMGARDFVAKPCPPDQLAAKLREAAGKAS